MRAGGRASGSLATLRAPPAMASACSVSPASPPLSAPAARVASDALPSFSPHASEQYESPRAEAAAVTRIPRWRKVQTARRECLGHQLEQPLQSVWLVRPQPGHVPYVAAVCEVLVVKRPPLGGHRGSSRKLPVTRVRLLRVCGPGSPRR